jgi:hypothetical protein
MLTHLGADLRQALATSQQSGPAPPDGTVSNTVSGGTQNGPPPPPPPAAEDATP